MGIEIREHECGKNQVRVAFTRTGHCYDFRAGAESATFKTAIVRREQVEEF